MSLGVTREAAPHPVSAGASAAVLPTLLALSVILLFPIVFAFYWPARGGLDVTGHQIGRDFINVWAGPQLAFGGALSTLFDLGAYHKAIGDLWGQPLPFHNWGYPLFVLPAFWPLSQLPYFAALAVWTFGLFAVFAGVTLSQIERPQRPYALLVLFLAPACLINTVGGQNGFLSAALLLGGVLALDKRPVLAGVLFGLLTFKPHLGLVLPFVLIALGAWRTIAAAIVTTLVLLLASVALFGIEPWQQYVAVAGPYQVMLLQVFKGFYASMMVSGVAGARTFGIAYPAAMTLQVVVSLSVIAITCWAVRATADPAARAFVVACAAPLVTPYAFNYDLTALAAAVVWTLFRPSTSGPVRTSLLGLGWLTPILAMYGNIYGVGLAPVALVVMFGFAVHEANRNATTRPGPEPRAALP
jgi:hypothetical protein